MPRLFVALACLAVTSCAPLAAAPRPAEPWRTETTLVTNIGTEPDTIDPQRVSFENEMSIVGMLYEPLLTWDARTLTLVPAAARGLPRVSDGGRTYTYTLRDGLTYSDGVPVTAQRFVDAFLRLCDPNVAGEYAFLAYPIAGCATWNQLDTKKTNANDLAAARAGVGVRALDALTLEFTLTAPFAAFPQMTAMPAGSPVRVEDVELVHRPGAGASLQLVRFVGNGPFVLSEWKHDQYMTFERNERYRLPVRLKTWKKVMIADASVARTAYARGDLDVTRVAPADSVEREALVARTDLVRTTAGCMTYVGFNTQRPPFDDPSVRMAFAKAINKDAIAGDLGLAVHVAPSFVTHDFPGHAHNDRTQDFDPLAARWLLASSKYGAPVDGKIGGIDLKFTYNARWSGTFPTRDGVRWVIAQWAASLGVIVREDPVDTTTSYGLVKRPEQQPLLRWMGWCADYPDGDAWYQDFTKDGPGARALSFADAEYDALVSAARSEGDPLARERIYDAASFRLSQQAPGAWLYWSERWWLVNPKVKGYEVSAIDWDFAQLSLARIVGR